MEISILKEDRIVMIDGVGMNFDFILPSNVWAIQWKGESGEIEFSDDTANEVITDFSAYQSFIDGHATEKQRREDELVQIEVDRVANLTYADKRKVKYDALNQFELIADDSINGTTTHKDAILAIKAEIPKT